MLESAVSIANRRFCVVVQDVFTFPHPNNDPIIDNRRAAHLTFDRPGKLLSAPASIDRPVLGIFSRCWKRFVRMPLAMDTYMVAGL